MNENFQVEETRIQLACERADYALAATLLVKAYGADIRRFIASLAHDRMRRAEAFSLFLEDLWLGLPRFEWRCPARAWAHTLARNATYRHGKQEARLRRRHEPLSKDIAEALTAQAPAPLPPYLMSTVKARVRALRQRLPPDDQSLLSLRIDENLPWNQLARRSSGRAGGTGRPELHREEQRLRKRFERAKSRLTKLARDEGLLDPETRAQFGNLPAANSNLVPLNVEPDYDDPRFNCWLEAASRAASALRSSNT
jgi:RNA polymerase sigma-70 factor, ECF subfamily